MSMAEVIKSIEREALREAQSHEIGGRNGEPIDCTLEDKPVIEADNEADRQAFRVALSQKFCGDISGGYLTKAPCISKDDSIPEELKRCVEEALKKRYCSTCRHYINRDGECCNADSDYCGGFRCLDDSCEHWGGW